MIAGTELSRAFPENTIAGLLCIIPFSMYDKNGTHFLRITLFGQKTDKNKARKTET